MIVARVLMYDFEWGVVETTSGEWLVRAGIALSIVYDLVLNVTIRESGVLKTTMSLRPQEFDKAVTRSLTATQLLSSAQGVGPAPAGFIGFVLTGNPLDFYVPAALSVVLLVLSRPRRSHWELVFRRAATEYPGVSPSPWGSVPS